MSCLVVYRNDDVSMVRPHVVRLPPSVDTFADLCQYLTEGIALPAAATGGRGFRFMYTLAGKPLWRVRECITAGTIVASTAPGFLPRIGEAPAVAAAPKPSFDISPDPKPVAAPRVQMAETAVYSAADSPPVPYEHNRTNIFTGGFLNLDSNNNNAVEVRSLPQPSLSSRVSQPYPNSNYSPLPRQVQEVGRVVPAAAPVAAPAAAAAGPYDMYYPIDKADNVVESEIRTVPTAAVAAAHPYAQDPMRRLFEESAAAPTQEEAFPASFTRPDAAHGDASEVKPQQQQQQQQQKRRAIELPHRQITIEGAAYSVPVNPTLPAPDTVASSATEPCGDVVPSLQLLFSRKWTAFRARREMDLGELVGAAYAGERFLRYMPPVSAPAKRAAYVVVKGPALSGKSFAAAELAEKAILCATGGGRFANYLFVPIDWTVFLPPSASSPMPSSPSAGATLWVDFASIYQVVVRTVMDAVAAQRPRLRQHASLLAELWEKVILPREEAPDFLSYHQIVPLVGAEILRRWGDFARLSFPLLRAACQPNCGTVVRDVALALLCNGWVNEMAYSLRFAGLFVALDGLDTFMHVLQHPAGRPCGDVEAMVSAFKQTGACVVLAAWPHADSTGVHIDRIAPKASICATVGMLREHNPESLGLPVEMRCRGKVYVTARLFLGAPGYLAVLLRLTASVRTERKKSILTNAQSIFLQQKQSTTETETFALVIDSDEAGRALERLQAAVAAVATPSAPPDAPAYS